MATGHQRTSTGSSLGWTTRSRYGLALLALLTVTGGFLWWQDTSSAQARQHVMAGTRFQQIGQNVAAEQEWRQAVRLDPSNAPAWELLGDFYLAARDWREAQNSLQRVLKLQPDTPDLLTRLAICAHNLGDTPAVRRYAEAAYKRNPSDVVSLRMLADLAKNAGRRDEQLTYLQRLVELQPRKIEALIALADELAARAEYAKARFLIERILKEDSSFAPAYFLRGLAFFNEDPTPEHLRKAEADFRKVLELKPRDIEAHRHLARVYLRLDRPAEAILHFEAVGRGRPFASAHLLELSNAYRAVGNVGQADILRQRFSSLRQENREIMDVSLRLDQNPNSFDDNLQMARLLLKSVNSSEASYHLYAYRYANGKLAGVESYARKAVQLRPADSQTKALERQIEQTYLRLLQVGQRELARKNYQEAGKHLNRATLLRPSDARTETASRQLASANIGAVAGAMRSAAP